MAIYNDNIQKNELMETLRNPSIPPNSPVVALMTSLPQPRKRFRILSCSGGGSRGILSSTVLHRISQLTGKHPTDLFDMMIGTSTGSIIISVMNVKDNGNEGNENNKPKYNTSALMDVYLNECPKVFSPSMWKNVTSMYGVYGGRFSNKVRDELFQKWLGDMMLSETILPLVIPSFDMCSKQPVFFKTRKARNDTVDDYQVQDAVKAALAAPTIFNPHKIGSRLYMDALYGKNPTMFAIIEAIKHYGVALEDIQLLHLGTGYSEDRNVENVQKITQSGVSYLFEVFNSAVNGNTVSTQYMSSELLHYRPDQCFSVDFLLESVHMGICDVTPSHLKHLHDVANNYVDTNLTRLADFCKELLSESSEDVRRLEDTVDLILATRVPLPEDPPADAEDAESDLSPAAEL